MKSKESKITKYNIKKGIEIGMIVCITIWVGVLCFYRLGEAATHNTDEARHIANAYEMFKNSPEEFYAVVTNVNTGRPEYIQLTILYNCLRFNVNSTYYIPVTNAQDVFVFLLSRFS